MSYIFNNFSTGKPDGPAFSSVVAVAREKGYTVRTHLTFLELIINLETRNPILRMISMVSTSPGNSPFYPG
jgi:homoserine dehydrogenase